MKVRTSGMRGFALMALSALAFTACDDKTTQPPPVPTPVTVTVVPQSANLQVGQTQDFAAIVGNAENTAVTWASSNTSVATVSANGRVTAVAAGSALITATSAQDPTKQGAASVVVTAAPIEQVTLQLLPSTATISVGGDVQLTSIVTGTSNTAVTYTSSAPAVATVNASSGLVTGVSQGTATIIGRSAANPAVADESVITVITGGTGEAVTITITPTSASAGVNGTVQFVATVGNASNTTVIWRSSDESVATVTQTGLATGRGPGTAVITAIAQADTTKRVSATLTVTGASVAIANISSTGGTFPDAVQGTVNTNVNVSVPAGTADSVAIRFTNTATGQERTVTCQRFTSAGAATTVTCPFNTIAQQLPNGTYQVSAVLFRANQVAATATFSQPITTANVNTATIQLDFDNGSDPNSGVDPLGRTWRGGSIIATVTPTMFTAGQTVATLSIGYDRNCDGTSESIRQGSFNSETGTFTATFPETAPGGSTQGVGGESDLGACVRVIDPRTETGAAVTLAGTASAPFNLDNLSPAFPGAVALPTSVPANNFINSGFTFRTSGSNSFVNAGAMDQAFGGGMCPAGTFAAGDECVNRVNVQIFAGLTSNFPSTASQTNLAAFAQGGANVTNQQVQNVSLLESNVSTTRYRTVLVARDTLGNQIYVAGPTFGVDLTSPSISATGVAAINRGADPASITVTVTDDFSGPNTARARITGHSVLEVDSDAGTEVRCYDNAGGTLTRPSSGVCPTFEVNLAAGAGTSGVGGINVPTDENFYVIEIVSTDQAGNVSATTVTRNTLRDFTQPTGAITTTTVSGTSVSISGEVRDNIDLDAYDLRFLVPGTTGQGGTDVPDEIPFVGMTNVDSYGLPLTGVASASGSNAVSIRQLDNAAPFDGAGALVPSHFGFGVFDVAGNTNLSNFAAQAASFTAAAGNGVANLNAFEITESRTTICRTGTTSACSNVNNTSTTISAIATTPVAANSNPFSTIYFYAVHPDGYNMLIGTASGANSTVQTGTGDGAVRTWTVTHTVAASALPTGAIQVFAIGVDAQGDAVISEVDTVTVQ